MENKTNELHLHDFIEWLSGHEITYAYSNRERKRLTSDMKGNLTVSVAGMVIYRGLQPSDAVRAYNSITDKYKQADFTL